MRRPLALTALTLLCAAAPAAATVPGANGRIAYNHNGTIHTVMPDGSDDRPVPRPDSEVDGCPAWSPDGSRIATCAATRGEHFDVAQLRILSPAGEALARIDVPNQHFAGEPAWSPDGARLAFAPDTYGWREIHTIRADGADLRRITNSEVIDKIHPDWSPDGGRIALSAQAEPYGEFDLYTMRPDGSDMRRVLDRPGDQYDPSWSPDGKRLVFSDVQIDQVDEHTRVYRPGRLMVADADGQDVRPITSGFDDSEPVWSPDGTMIAFTRWGPVGNYGGHGNGIAVVSASGGPVVLVTPREANRSSPDWQAIGFEFGRPAPPAGEPVSEPAPPVPPAPIAPAPPGEAAPPVVRLTMTLSRTRFRARGRGAGAALTLRLSEQPGGSGEYVRLRILRAGGRPLVAFGRTMKAARRTIPLPLRHGRRLLRPGRYVVEGRLEDPAAPAVRLRFRLRR